MGKTDNEAREELRDKIKKRLSEELSLPFDRRQARCSHDTHNTRLVIAVSQLYLNYSYEHWFCYSLKQQDFLWKAGTGYLALGMLDSGKMYLIPLDTMNALAKHIYYCKIPQRFDIWVKKIGRRDVMWMDNDPDGFDLTPYEL